MSKRKKPLLEKVEITGIGSEGKALGRVEDMVVFVPMLVPGDIVDIQVTKKRKNYMEGYVTKYHKYSDIRQEVKCEHFGVCGGCKWQHLPYEKQLDYKQNQVRDNFARIGKFSFPELRKIIGSANTYYYRNKLEFTFSNRRWLTSEEIGSGEEKINRDALGFHIPGMFDKVLNIDHCCLQEGLSNDIRNSVRKYSLEHGLEYFDFREHKGFLRTLIIRTSLSGQLMVIISFHYEDKEKREGLLNFLNEKFPGISSLMYVINPKPHDSIGELKVELFAGNDHIVEAMEGLKFMVGPKSFYQTNTLQAYELYKVAREFADLTGAELVYDLYTGTGTIANFVSSGASKVIGVDYVPEAIKDAKANSQLNGIENTSFVAGDLKDIMNDEFIKRHGNPDVIITDPPRAGMHEKVVLNILKMLPSRIVYISCNPATQARDLSLLSNRYDVVEIQPVDMFPQTHHVENVVLLRLKV